MPTNNLAVPSPSLRVYQCNKRDMQSRVAYGIVLRESGYARLHGACDSNTNTLKIAGSAMQNEFQCYRCAVASFLVKRAKDKTVRKSTNLQLSVGTVIAKVPNCIPRFCIVYIDTTAFLFMVR